MINLGAIARDLMNLRRKAAQDFTTFRKYYFSQNHDTPDGPMQKEVSQLLSKMVNKRGSKLTIAAPRNFAKSTLISLEFVVFCACHKREAFIVVVSATQSQATKFLRNIKREFETNEKLRQDFPEVCGVTNKSVSQRWSETEIITGNDVDIIALSTGQQIRSMRHGNSRPTLIILDDIITGEVARNPESVYNLEEWIVRDVLNAGTKTTNIIFVGTIHHPNALLGKYTDPKQTPGWTSRVYKAVKSFASQVEEWDKWANIFQFRDSYNNEFGPEAAKKFFNDNKDGMLKGVELLWPERISYYELMVIREERGYPNFESEYQNQPVNPAECIFNANNTYYWDDDFRSQEDLMNQRRSHLMFYGGCDPSPGKDRLSGDPSAIVTIAIDATTGIVYVLDVDAARRTPDQTIDAIIKYASVREYISFVFETNLFQEVMAGELERRARESGCFLRLERVNNTSNKQVRIEQLQPLFNSGKIRISKRHRALIEEMRFYPKGAHDDILDALEMTVRIGLQKSKTAMAIMARKGYYR